MDASREIDEEMGEREGRIRFETQSLTSEQEELLRNFEATTSWSNAVGRRQLAEVLERIPIGPKVAKAVLLQVSQFSGSANAAYFGIEHLQYQRLYAAALRGQLNERELSTLFNRRMLPSPFAPEIAQAFAWHIRAFLQEGKSTVWLFSWGADEGIAPVLECLSKDEQYQLFLSNAETVPVDLIEQHRQLFSNEELQYFSSVRALGGVRQAIYQDYILDNGMRSDVSAYLSAAAKSLHTFSAEQLGVYLKGCHLLKMRTLTVKDLADMRVAQETAEHACHSVYAELLERNIGYAVQFAWRYPELNIQNIPASLNAAGLRQGVRMPEEILDYVGDVVSKGLDLDAAVVSSRKTHALTPGEFVEMREDSPELMVLRDGKPDYEALCAKLVESERHIPDSSIRDGLRQLRDMVGAEVAMKYANRVDLTRHDAFYFSDRVAHLFQRSGRSAAECANILLQVAKDDAVYEQGTAHHDFATVVHGLTNTSPEQILRDAAAYPRIEQMQELVRSLQETGGMHSWKQLKKLHQLHEFLGKQEILAELEQGDLSPALRSYVTKLAFHPNISMEKVLEFWKNPHHFLEINDAHTDEEINAAKKPSNYLSLPFLGLHAEDLRDALVEGSIDRIQTLPAYERTYTIYPPDADPRVPANLHRGVRRAIGQQRFGVPGMARDAKKLFAEVQKWCREQRVVWQELWDEVRGGEMLAGLGAEQRDRLSALVFDAQFGMTAPEGETYRVTMGLKSDPDMVVAGNDTASCMPFGSGKNNVYMYNPNCVQLVVQRKTGEDGWRTAAQSVVNIDIETGRPTPELIAAYKEKDAHLKDILDVSALQQLGVITCDNIEIAKNDEGRRIEDIRRVYTDFFTEYLREYAASLNVDTQRVVVGMGYTPAEFGLPHVANTFIPLAPMGYSDNAGAKSLALHIDLPANEYVPKTGVAPMTTRDVLAVAILEGKAYHDNVSLLENLHGMQNNIIGMEIANAHEGRPNLSFVYRDGKGAPKGYMLAYEGRNGQKQEVFIADLAADPESKLAGGNLIKAFFDAYVVNYGKGERPFLPIFTNARDQTSYRIIQSQFQRFLDRAGLAGEIVEVSQYWRGPDLMHDVRLFIGRDREEIDAAKERYSSLDMSNVRSWDDF